MKDARFWGVTWNFRLFSAKTQLSGPRRPWRLLAVCLGVLTLLLATLSPAAAGDGALDPTFITGSGNFAGVQNLPEIRGQINYPNVAGSPYNGCQLLFGRFWGVYVAVPAHNTTDCPPEGRRLAG